MATGISTKDILNGSSYYGNLKPQTMSSSPFSHHAETSLNIRTGGIVSPSESSIDIKRKKSISANPGSNPIDNTNQRSPPQINADEGIEEEATAGQFDTTKEINDDEGN